MERMININLLSNRQANERIWYDHHLLLRERGEEYSMKEMELLSPRTRRAFSAGRKRVSRMM